MLTGDKEKMKSALYKKALKRIKKELPPKKGERLITRKKALDTIFFNDEALDIISRSEFTTYNKFKPHRDIRVANILNDFFCIEHFKGKTVLELGPGHYGFAMLARSLGAEVICVERYPVHVELGINLGFEVLDIDFEKISLDTLNRRVDGIWMKSAFNSCRFKNIEAINDFVRQMTEILTPDGWGWAVTINKAGNLQGLEKERFEDERILAQKESFERYGWKATPIIEEDRKRYAVSFAGSRWYFTRNLL